MSQLSSIERAPLARDSGPRAPEDPGSRARGRPAVWLELVRFQHTLFALPWAVAGLLLGARGLPDAWTAFWVVVAMVGARTAAMAWNRLVDRRFDATNPRTSTRPSVTGEVSRRGMVQLTGLAAGIFVVAAYQLNPLCGALAWPTLLLLLGYSFAKRVTSLSHFVLGLSLGLSPLGAYLAAHGTFDAGSAGAAALGGAVLAWTAGFDILYACQDVDHDRAEGLHSVPARLGIGRSLLLARTCHAFVPALLVLCALLAGLGTAFYGGVAIVAVLLLVEHRLVRADDLRRVGQAFFHVNVAIAFVMLAATLADVLLRSGR